MSVGKVGLDGKFKFVGCQAMIPMIAYRPLYTETQVSSLRINFPCLSQRALQVLKCERRVNGRDGPELNKGIEGTNPSSTFQEYFDNSECVLRGLRETLRQRVWRVALRLSGISTNIRPRPVWSQGPSSTSASGIQSEPRRVEGIWTSCCRVKTVNQHGCVTAVTASLDYMGENTAQH